VAYSIVLISENDLVCFFVFYSLFNRTPASE